MRVAHDRVREVIATRHTVKLKDAMGRPVVPVGLGAIAGLAPVAGAWYHRGDAPRRR